MALSDAMGVKLSIVIPTLNEVHALPETLLRIHRMAKNEVEVIVSDCGSDDETVRLARVWGTRVVFGGSCRASAMNAGACVARGEVLLFLHADVLVPEHFDTLIEEALDSDSHAVGGAFGLAFSERKHPGIRMVEWCNRVRYHRQKLYYGDQGIFVRRETFMQVRGFPHVCIMEDAHFCRKLKTVGEMVLVDDCMQASPRRFYEHGVWRMFCWDTWMVLRDTLGLSNDRYALAYRGQNVRRGRVQDCQALCADG